MKTANTEHRPRTEGSRRDDGRRYTVMDLLMPVGDRVAAVWVAAAAAAAAACMQTVCAASEICVRAGDDDEVVREMSLNTAPNALFVARSVSFLWPL